jgi:hypothetical protein
LLQVLHGLEVTAHIDGLLQRGAVWREVGHGLQRLFPVSYGFPIRRPDERLGARLLAVGEGLVPHLAAQGMMRQAVDLLGPLLGHQRLEGLNNVRVQHPPPLQQQATIGYLVRQGMLKGVCRLREQARLRQKLRRLEVRQALLELLLRLPGQRLQERAGHIHPDHRRDLEQPFGRRGQPVHARRQHRLHRLRHHTPDVRLVVCHGMPGQLLQKEGVPPRLGE